jgi:putative hydrolase of the HAD superfamily
MVSDIADYAQNLQETEYKKNPRTLFPITFRSRAEKIYGVRAVICDVYGTMINYWRPEFGNKEGRTNALLKSFNAIAQRFGMLQILKSLNPDESPEKTLSDFYNGLIALKHEQALKKGTVYPEVKIEEIWSLILLILKKHGYKSSDFCSFPDNDVARYIAYTYNFISLGREFYPGVVTALEKLTEQNISLGMVSNAQFYTPIDLTLLIREQSNQKIDDYLELFDDNLTFFSYEYGVAKPNQLLIRKLFDALYEFNILPSETVFVGNDLSIDIKPAIEAGMKTALFIGDKESAFVSEPDVTPDITFENWIELPEKLSFFSGENKQ